MWKKQLLNRFYSKQSVHVQTWSRFLLKENLRIPLHDNTNTRTHKHPKTVIDQLVHSMHCIQMHDGMLLIENVLFSLPLSLLCSFHRMHNCTFVAGNFAPHKNMSVTMDGWNQYNNIRVESVLSVFNCILLQSLFLFFYVFELTKMFNLSMEMDFFFH